MRLLKESKKLHRQLWLWLAKNPDMAKKDWPGWIHNGGPVKETQHDCFLCERYQHDKEEFCDCPIEWSKGDRRYGPCEAVDSTFYEWYYCSPDIQERSRLARQIAGMWR